MLIRDRVRQAGACPIYSVFQSMSCWRAVGVSPRVWHERRTPALTDRARLTLIDSQSTTTYEIDYILAVNPHPAFGHLLPEGEGQ